jgi:hypothetical protein
MLTSESLASLVAGDCVRGTSSCSRVMRAAGTAIPASILPLKRPIRFWQTGTSNFLRCDADTL